jgi:general nucleoside transport system ATP-binding protein
VLVVSEEIDELFELSDRLQVIAKGKLSPPLARGQASVELVGQWMSGLWHDTREVAHAAA